MQNCDCQSSLVNYFYNESVVKCYNKNSTAYSCEREKAIAFYSSVTGYQTKCECPIECEKTYFTHSVSVAEYPTLKYSNYLRNTSLIRLKYSNITYDKMKKSVSRIQIYFNEMKKFIFII